MNESHLTEIKSQPSQYGSIIWLAVITALIINIAFYVLWGASSQSKDPVVLVSSGQEVSLRNYELILKRQKKLNSTYFNQKVALAISDKKITQDEFGILNSEYDNILKARKASGIDPYGETGVITIEDELKSVKKEIRLHALSQNDNLI